MLEQGKISTRQHVLLLFCIFSFATSFGIPHSIIVQARQDFWQSLLMAYLADALLAIVYYVLGRRYPEQTMVQYAQLILGPLLGKIIGFNFVVFFLYVSAFILHLVSNILGTLLMPETPILVFSITIIIISAYAVNSGLEVIARLSEIVAPVIIASLIIIVTLSLNYSRPVNLLPMFQHTPVEILKASLMPMSLFGICIIMGMFMAYQNKPQESLKAKLIAITIGTAMALLTLFQVIAVLGVNTVNAQLYPVFRMSQMIRIGDIFERLESLFMVVLISGSVVAVSSLFWAGSVGLAQVFKFKKLKSVTPYTGGIILLAALFLFGNVSEKNRILTDWFPYIGLFVEVFLVCFLLVVSFLRHGRRTEYMTKRGNNDD